MNNSIKYKILISCIYKKKCILFIIYYNDKKKIVKLFFKIEIEIANNKLFIVNFLSLKKSSKSVQSYCFIDENDCSFIFLLIRKFFHFHLILSRNNFVTMI